MPTPRDAGVRDRLRKQRVRDTKPEMAIRRALHAAGLRYRVDAKPEPDLRVRADIVFTRARVAVFIDGCFWHGCPEHFVPPKNNAEWWAKKIEGNRIRDAQSRGQLVDSGWSVLSIWEHADPSEATGEILTLIRTAQSGTSE